MRLRALVAVLACTAGLGCRLRLAAPSMTKDQADFVRLVSEGDGASVQAMLAKGFPINGPIPIGSPQGSVDMTPLMLAALDGQVEMARLLLKAGADLRAKDEHGWTALFFVQSEPGDESGLAMTQFLVGAGMPVDEPDAKNAAPLLYAVAANNPLQVEFLLGRGADPNRRANDGDSPLFHAVINGNSDIVQSLVSRGAQVNARQPDGGTPLLALPELGLPYDSEQRIALYLLLHGADPNLADHNGYTPLLNAVRNRDTDLAKLLLRFRADPNLGGKSKKLNALMLCVETQNYEIAQLLMAYHADPNVKLGPDGVSAYSVARQLGDGQMLAALGGR